MATNVDGFSRPTHSSEELLTEIRSFVYGSHAVHGRKLTSEEHAKSALFLLRTLPSARSAVLEHLCHVFDESVNTHVVELDGEESLAPNLDDMIGNIHDVLLGFVKKNSEGWAPLIFTWSIDLLGQISSKYAGRRGVPHSSSLNELLQLWMTCKATRSLMEIATQCIAVLIRSCPDFCVDALLDTSVLHSPHFDWVVAHIGSCFPETIITRVLSCGLKDFCSHGSSQGESVVRTEKKVPKMASVVGILGHLAAQHSKDIRKALLELFQASVDSTDEQQLSTVPFLLQLATMSPMLLKVITTDLVDCLTPEVLNRLSDQFYNSPVILQDADGLITLVIHLICKSGSGTSKLLHFVLDTAAPQITENRMEDDEIVVSERVQQCAALILDLLLLNLQRGVYSKTGGRFRSGQSEMSEIPFLIELQRHSSDLCKDILTATGKRLYWLQRLLSVIGVHCGESCASDILSYLMLNTKSENKSSQVRLFLDLQAGLESSLPTVLHVAVKKSLYHLQNANDIQMLQLLTNLTLLVKWEGSRQGQETAKTQLRRILQNSVQILSCLLYHPSPSMSYQTIKLLDLVGIATNTNADTLTHLVQCTMQYFFNTLHKQERKTDAIVTTVRYLRTLSCHPPSQTTVLQFLVQAVVKRENSYLFGGKLGDNASIKDPAASQLSLHQNNLKHALSVTVPATASTVFHAGVIGKGKRQKVERTISPQHVQMQNIQAVLDTLYSCGILDTKKPNQMDSSFSRTPKLLSAQSSNTVASLLVQFACPDVIHAGTQWPDEELMKYTIERDLHIKKKFEDNPVLWDLLRIVAKAKPALCQCSVLIYGLLSTLLAFWESNREKQACDSPKQMQMSVRLLECMALADFLPRPLGQVGELLHLLTPYEVYLLLVNTWAYMKEHPPSEKSFTDEEKTSQQPVEPRYTKILHFTLHHNIGACGHLFPRFFNLDSISR